MKDYLPEEKPIELGDKRLSKRYDTILERSVKQSSLSIPATFKDWHQIKAVYRFFDNPNVTDELLLKHHYQQSLEHIAQLEDQEDILLIQDTTDVNHGFSWHYISPNYFKHLKTNSGSMHCVMLDTNSYSIL